MRGATNESGNLEDVFAYDAFGTPVSGDFNTGLHAGYTGKPYDSVTGLYDYGYRDYSPQSVRFTTVDPIRDDSNWFACVNNDPVNFLDPDGLEVLGLTSNNKLTDSEWKEILSGNSATTIGAAGCTVTAWTNIINTENENQAPATVGGKDSNYMDGSKLNTRESGFNGLTNSTSNVIKTSNTPANPNAVSNVLAALETSSKNYYVTGCADISYKDSTGKVQTINHEVNITGVNLNKEGTIVSINIQGTGKNDASRKYQMEPVEKGAIGVGQISEIYSVESKKKINEGVFMKSKTFICILFIITFICLCSSCFSLKRNNRKVINSTNLTYDEINFFYKENSFNFISDHLDHILAVFGKPLKIEEVGGNENGSIARSVFSGFGVEYYSSSGILRGITIENSELSIINGFTIGDKKKDIEKYLINGIYYQADKSYLFFHMNEDQESGIGYEIYYDDKDNVQKIVVSVMPLAI